MVGRIFPVFLAVVFVAGCQAASSEPAPSAPPPGVEVVEAPVSGEEVFISFSDFSGYTHRRPDPVAVQFPLYPGKRWVETMHGRASVGSWDIIFTVVEITDLMTAEGASLRAARISIFVPGSSEYRSFRGECIYSPAWERVRCSE